MMSTPVREALKEPALNLDEVCASGTRLAWAFGLALVAAFLAAVVWGGTRDAGYATPRDPGIAQQKEARTR